MTSHRGLPEPLPPLPKSPSGRTPQWVINEALARQRLSASSDPRRRRRAAGRGVDPGATGSDWRRWEPPTPPP